MWALEVVRRRVQILTLCERGLITYHEHEMRMFILSASYIVTVRMKGSEKSKDFWEAQDSVLCEKPARAHSCADPCSSVMKEHLSQVSLQIKPPGGTAGGGRIFTQPKIQGWDLNQKVIDCWVF